MPISWRAGFKGMWPVVVYSDPYTVAELDRVLTEILAAAIPGSPLRILVDRRHCQAPTTAFVTHIAAFVKRHHKRFVDAHVAIVTSDAAGFGMARMTEILVEGQGVPCRLHAFHDWDEAERWLAESSAAT